MKGGVNMCATLDYFETKGREEGREDVVSALVETCQELGVDYDATVRRLEEKLNWNPEAAEKYAKMYWK